ncbi:histidine phosphatase family protein [Nodosilinea sp. PGN35]|uniref:histidine phosphatase family protein n=1 Tax=Nodosilinea sp. PGN35 TaxID=3020489 RepID=UPI0023B32D7A|nr:histidine phosphatase family protein [Nodosilinea sp. TSF1-S3]MDF0368658.1 histidine phosphatase family protein [Nodosilinea sp. TSF1-S3]
MTFEALEPALAVPTLAQAAPQHLAAVAATAREPVTVWEHLEQADRRLYAVLLRHALAPGSGDPPGFQLGDCATQRNLSAEGQDQARRIGAAFRQRDIDVVKVLSSQWCRSLDTAELMALGPVEPFEPINSFFRDRGTAAQQTAQVRDYLRRQPNRGVIVMVTHQVNITALTGVVPGSGQAVVLTLDDEENLAQVGLLSAGE